MLLFSSSNTAAEHPQVLCSILGHGNERKRHKLEAVTIRAKAIIRCQHYYVYSAYENLRSTEMFYSRGV